MSQIPRELHLESIYRGVIHSGAFLLKIHCSRTPQSQKLTPNAHMHRIYVATSCTCGNN